MTIPKPSEMFTTVTVKRRAAGSYVDGIWTPGAETTPTVSGSVQPLRSDELKNLPEAQRVRGVRKIYTDSMLQTADEANAIQADRITYDGEDWEVHKIDDHDMNTLAHYKAIIVRMDRA